ncbi:GNAT family N-acetyltransferase [Alkalicoccobacillus gibsonii]|uniref:GNAT family N-acetyltransferase n=1 Tax=Alkalicoccobacillus gibsonii TaxID=79881 RepID=UPI003516AECC
MISLREISSENIDKVIALEVGANQREYINTTNLRSFADAHVLRNDGILAAPLAIYHEDILIGFIMYIYDTLDHESFEHEVFFNKKSYFIWHFMIDRRFQGKRYGKRAFEMIIKNLNKQPFGDAEYISLFYHTDNVKAKELYLSFGFVETNIVQDQSVLAIKSIK